MPDKPIFRVVAPHKFPPPSRRRLPFALGRTFLALAAAAALISWLRRQRSTGKAQDERERLHPIFEAMSDAVIICDKGGALNQLNAPAEKLLGITADAARGRTMAEICALEPAAVESLLAEARSNPHMTPRRLPPDTVLRAISGELVPVSGSIMALPDQMGALVILKDDRERALLEHQHAQSEQRIGQLMKLVEAGHKRLQDTIDAVPAIVWEAIGPPDDQHMVFVSNYAETLSGYSAQEWIDGGDLAFSMIAPEDLDEVRQAVALNYHEDVGLPIHYRLRRKDGHTRWVEAHISTVRDSSNRPIGMRGVTTDISGLRQIEAELRRSNEELQQFAYVASHDLQEPLRMVTSYLQLIEQRYADQLDEQAHEFIAFAVDGAARMKQLVTDLLAYSRLQTSHEDFQQVNLNTLMDDVLQNLEAQIEESAASIKSDALPVLSGNPVLLTQLFQNLITNALKFRRAEPPQIEVRAQRIGLMWQFAVHDNGIGFDARYADRIFVLFQRLHSQAKYPGTGIGLTICRKVVETHSGEIWVESEAGRGSTFYFTLPAQPAGEKTDAD